MILRFLELGNTAVTVAVSLHQQIKRTCQTDLVHVQIIRDNYTDMVDWLCDVIPWEKTKDLPEKDRSLLFLALESLRQDGQLEVL
jgi:hypothetical protein